MLAISPDIISEDADAGVIISTDLKAVSIIPNFCCYTVHSIACEHNHLAVRLYQCSFIVTNEYNECFFVRQFIADLLIVFVSSNVLVIFFVFIITFHQIFGIYPYVT